MTEEQIIQIEARIKAASKPPWRLVMLDGRCRIARDWVGRKMMTLATCATPQLSYDQTVANARLMAHAREDLPALCAEVRRLNPMLSDTESLLWEIRRLNSELEQRSGLCKEISVVHAILPEHRKDVASRCAAIASACAKESDAETGKEVALRIAERILREFGLGEPGM